MEVYVNLVQMALTVSAQLNTRVLDAKLVRILKKKTHFCMSGITYPEIWRYHISRGRRRISIGICSISRGRRGISIGICSISRGRRGISIGICSISIGRSPNVEIYDTTHMYIMFSVCI
jgi:hypothetical protein